MTENKRFYKAYCCGDTGVIDKVENEWFIENINSISDIEKNWDNVIDKLNQVAEENEQLKREVKRLKCINKQLEERLDKDIALNMDCGEVDCPTSCSSCKYYRANDNYCYYFNDSV